MTHSESGSLSIGECLLDGPRVGGLIADIIRRQLNAALDHAYDLIRQYHVLLTPLVAELKTSVTRDCAATINQCGPCVPQPVFDEVCTLL